MKKKIRVILIVTLMLAGVLSSCNQYVCPAYVDSETEQIENNG